jgi:hypothetical protein
MPKSPVRYRLSSPISAVRLEEQHGSALRNPTKTLVDIPAEAIVALEGVAAPSGLVNVIWEGNPFSVFYEDLRTAGKPETTAH